MNGLYPQGKSFFFGGDGFGWMKWDVKFSHVEP